MGSLVIFTLLIFVFESVNPATVMLTGNSYVQKGQEIKLNCSSNFIPIGQTAEFLVNNVTFTNIRKHKWVCFNTKLNKACSSGTCRCAEDRKSYMSIFKPQYINNKVTFICRMKFSGGTAELSDELAVTIIDISSPKIRMEEKLPLISETSVNLLCSATKTNSSFHIVWKCGNVIYKKTTMENETFVWSTLKLKIDSTYNGIQCICKVHAKKFDFTVSDFVTLRVKKTPILTLNNEFYCNSSNTVALVCSVRGELGMFGFNKWIHTVDGEYVRSLPGKTDKYLSLLIFNDCSFQDGGKYTCVVWNEDGDSILWANQTTSLQFVGPPIILSKTVKDKDVGRQIMVTFYTSSSFVSVNWQCNGLEMNNSLLEFNLKQIPTDFEIYNKKISLLAYKTYILADTNQCLNGNYGVCLSNNYSAHCEKIMFTKHVKGENGFNVLWIMLVVVFCVVAVGIAPPLVGVVKNQLKNASQSIQLEEVDRATTEGRYLQINEPDQIAPHQNDTDLSPYIDPVPYHSTSNDETALRPNIDSVPYHSTRGDETALMPNIDSVPYHSTRGDETALRPNIDSVPYYSTGDDETVGRPYNDLVPYQSSRGYDVTSPEYLDVQPDTDTNSSQSDQYEKVE